MRDEELEDWFSGDQGRRARREIASVIEKWSQSLSNATQHVTLDVFNRHRWNGVNHVHATMSQCAWAVENDDILSTLADVLEGLMWQKCRFELFDDDQQDIWNQWAADVNLDALSEADGPRGVQGLPVLRRPVVGAPGLRGPGRLDLPFEFPDGWLRQYGHAYSRATSKFGSMRAQSQQKRSERSRSPTKCTLMPMSGQGGDSAALVADSCGGGVSPVRA